MPLSPMQQIKNDLLELEKRMRTTESVAKTAVSAAESCKAAVRRLRRELAKRGFLVQNDGSE